MAIAPDGSDGSRKTGAFLAFVPEQDVNEVRNSEDGLFFLLSNSDWQKVREALLSGSDVSISPRETTGASISIRRVKPQTYLSPVTGEMYVSEGWTTHEPHRPALKLP